MPRYFFHLTFGDRVVPDEEGTELTSRAEARDEAIGAARELNERTKARPRSRWASWFLQVADEQGAFLRVPLGYPALEVVSADNPAIEIAVPGPQAMPVIQSVAVAAEFPRSHTVLAVIRRALARRRDYACSARKESTAATAAGRPIRAQQDGARACSRAGKAGSDSVLFASDRAAGVQRRTPACPTCVVIPLGRGRARLWRVTPTN
jgi:hypothetical protein